MLFLALAVQLLAASPALPNPALGRAIVVYRQVLAGQRQVSDLTPQDRLALAALQRELRSEEGMTGAETREQCFERLGSKSPTALEKALLDLKCSQRSSRPR